MPGSGDAMRLTGARAVVRGLVNRVIEIDRVGTPVGGGGFGIFGHGNPSCLGAALYPVHIRWIRQEPTRSTSAAHPPVARREPDRVVGPVVTKPL